MAIIWDDKTNTHTIFYKGDKVGDVIPGDFDKDKSVATCQTDIAAKMTKEDTMEVRISITDKPTSMDAARAPKYLIGHGPKGFKFLGE
jgi:hypothetical protein